MRGGTGALLCLYAENLQADFLKTYAYVYTYIHISRKLSVIMFALGFQDFC